MDTLFYLIPVALLVTAALFDLATMEIPDWISIALAVTFPVAALLSGLGWSAFGAHAAIGALAFLAVLILFRINVIGGGDAKVIAAAALWLGPGGIAAFIVFTALAGGALAAAMVTARALVAPAPTRPAAINRLLDPSGGIPYAVAIAAGGLLALAHAPLAGRLIH